MLHFKISRWNLFVAFLIILTLCPIRVGGSFAIGQAAYYSVVLLAILLVVGSFFSPNVYTRISSKYGIIALLMMFWTSLLAVFNYDRLVPKDFFDVVRPAIYLVMFLFGYIFSSKKDEQKLIEFLLWLFLIQVLFSSTVYIDAFTSIQDIYKGRTSEDSVAKHFFRYSGTFGFPGAFGAIITIFVVWYYALISKSFSFKKCIIFLVFLLGLLMSGSRGAIIVALPIIIAISFRYYFYRYLVIGSLLLGAMIFFIVVKLQVNIHAISYILELAEKGTSEGSLVYRLGEIGLSAKNLEETYFIGTGPNNDYFQNYHGPIESLYLNYLGRFGVFGFSLVAVGTILAFLRVIKLSKITNNVEGRYFYSSFGYWLLFSVFIGGISTSIIDQIKISAFIFIILGCSFRIYDDYNLEARQT